MSRLSESCGEQHDEFLELVLIHPVRPIHTDEELCDANRMADDLLDRCELSEGAKDYLELLTHTIEKYESENVEIDDASDADVLTHLMEARGINQTTVSMKTGIVASTISDVMNGRRKFTREHIGKLAAYFRVAPTVFSFEAE
jgi:HTH-type transcriptional regulator/antitoxin HigA